MAALAVGSHFGIVLEDAVKAIESYVPANNRSQMTRTEHNTLIVDAYNANPTSMAAALDNFSNVSAECRIAMLGDMLELGEDSAAEHEAVMASAVSRGFSRVFFVGKEFSSVSQLCHSDDVKFFLTSDELADYLKTDPVHGATILIKGSRGTRMEKVIPML